MANSIKKLITTRGEEYTLVPVSDTLITKALAHIEKTYRAQGEPLDCPRYKVETAGGGEQWFEHDAHSLQTDEEKAAWAAYQDARQRLEAEQEQLRLKLILGGVQFEIPDNNWEAAHRRLGVEVPDREADPFGYREHYLTTEVLVTPDDLLNAIELVTKLSYKGGVDEAAVEAAMSNFRRALLENTAGQTADRTRAVEPQPEDGGDRGGAGVGADPQPAADAAG